MIGPWLATTGAICATNLVTPTAGNVVMVTDGVGAGFRSD
jgi:hypothetical protein